ncbi:MAG TPA: GTPase HflX, partial [Clostridiaceae bacterium]|nr:GTPase HflX [Clostridiaceae bacterium]
ERAILFGLNRPGRGEKERGERSLEELAALAEACGAVVVNSILQTRMAPDSATFIGKGKLTEIRTVGEALGANLLICDDELTGSQLRNIETETGLHTIDQTNLILDIFARRATTREGRWQVELAQHQYRLPRLKSVAGELSRQGGGIGTRGPGETKLETDRRYIRRRIQKLKKNLKQLSGHRELLRHSRDEQGVCTIAVVGYTNAGKSTLVNRLCNSDLFVADQVFATLDATVRQLFLPGNQIRQRDTVLIDTIGFINKLPHELIEAFKSTLAEAAHADLLLLVVDGSDPDADEKLQTTCNLLDEIGAGNIPRVTAINKIDKINSIDISSMLYSLSIDNGDGSPIEVSAVTGHGLDNLRTRLDERLNDLVQPCYRTDYGRVHR